MVSKKLPKFRKPPVVEAYCGISFHELGTLHAPQLGGVAKMLRSEYPIIETHPPLGPTLPPGQPLQILIQFGASTQFRTWLISEDRARLIQIQRDRLIFNWRQNALDSSYPSYTVLRRSFAKAMDKFFAFLNRENIAEPQVSGVEFGYVNLIPLPQEMRATKEISDIFPLFSLNVPAESVLGALSAVNWQSRFDFPHGRGHLHVGIQSAQLPSDGRPALRFDLASRWLAPLIPAAKVLPWMDEAHEITVNSFVQLTSSTMQSGEWERYQ
jgi:uncharacterized protein (TIGR04255 family)